MASFFVRISDKVPVTEDEAMVNGVLRDGYRMHFATYLSDAARAVAMTGGNTNFVDHLPSHMLPHLTRMVEDANSNEVFRAQAAANTARRMADEITRTRCAGAASPQAAQYVAGIADRAQARAASLGGTPARATTITKDQTMDITDSVMRMPDSLRSKIMYSLGDMQAGNRMQVENGMRHLSGIVSQLEGISGHGPAFVADGQFNDAAAVVPDVVAGLKAEIGKARDRLPNLR